MCRPHMLLLAGEGRRWMCRPRELLLPRFHCETPLPRAPPGI